jgi:hypothetical protein
VLRVNNLLSFSPNTVEYIKKVVITYSNDDSERGSSLHYSDPRAVQADKITQIFGSILRRLSCVDSVEISEISSGSSQGEMHYRPSLPLETLSITHHLCTFLTKPSLRRISFRNVATYLPFLNFFKFYLGSRTHPLDTLVVHCERYYRSDPPFFSESSKTLVYPKIVVKELILNPSSPEEDDAFTGQSNVPNILLEANSPIDVGRLEKLSLYQPVVNSSEDGQEEGTTEECFIHQIVGMTKESLKELIVHMRVENGKFYLLLCLLNL